MNGGSDLLSYVVYDNSFYRNCFDNWLKTKNVSDDFKLLFLFPFRLGIEKINECYYPFLESFFACQFFVGIVGGSGSSSFYVLGKQKAISIDRILSLFPSFILSFLFLCF